MALLLGWASLASTAAQHALITGPGGFSRSSRVAPAEALEAELKPRFAASGDGVTTPIDVHGQQRRSHLHLAALQMDEGADSIDEKIARAQRLEALALGTPIAADSAAAESTEAPDVVAAGAALHMTQVADSPRASSPPRRACAS